MNIQKTATDGTSGMLNLDNHRNSDRVGTLLTFIEKRGKASVNQIIEELGISRQALYKHYLTPLLDANAIAKFGKPPKVYYSIKIDQPKTSSTSAKIESVLVDYIQITPSGQLLKGDEAFTFWCQERDYDRDTYLKEYKDLQKNNLKFKDSSGLISADKEMRETFADYCLAKTAYVDFYADEIFGKTSLGQLVLYAKQAQDKKLFKQILSLTEAKINTFIKLNKIEVVCFIPPTVKRQQQLMGYLNNHLAINIPRIKLSKIVGDIITPQKTLSKLKDRIININQTVFVGESLQVNGRNILIIDDAVGSGASFNEVAKMLNNLEPDSKIYGLALVGSKKGFDVINEA